MSTMQSEGFRKADAIITADIHLRESTPICRTDNFFEALFNKIKFLKELKKQHKCKIIDGGDLFDSAKSSLYLVGWALKKLPPWWIGMVIYLCLCTSEMHQPH